MKRSIEHTSLTLKKDEKKVKRQMLTRDREFSKLSNNQSYSREYVEKLENELNELKINFWREVRKMAYNIARERNIVFENLKISAHRQIPSYYA